MRCTGPYTRVLFDKSEAKSARGFMDGLKALHADLNVRHLPQGVNGLEDFALDADVPATQDGGVWEVRAAKYQGPKKLFGRIHIYDAALRHRSPDGQIQWEGYLFAASLKALGQAVAAALPDLQNGTIPPTLLDRDDAEIHRIELCTGEPL